MMVQFIRDVLSKVLLSADRHYLSKRMGLIIKGKFQLIKQMDLVFLRVIPSFMRVTGSMTILTVKVDRSILKILTTMVTLRKEKKMGRESTSGIKTNTLRGSFKMIRFMGGANT